MSVPYDEAAAQAAAAVQQPDLVPASAVNELAHTDRPAPLPAELDQDRLMAEFEAMSGRLAAMESELADTRKGYAAAVAALGPPEVAVYAKGIFDKLVSFRNAHPDLPGHFDSVIEKARPLADAATAVIEGDQSKVPDLARDVDAVVAAVERFTGRTHQRLSNKPLDFSALLSDVEYAQEAAAKLAAVA